MEAHLGARKAVVGGKLGQAAPWTRGTGFPGRWAFRDFASREGALKADRWRRLTQAELRLAGPVFLGAFP